MKYNLIAAAAFVALGVADVSAQTIATANTSVGSVVVAAKNGMTLYTFRKDKKDRSNCYNDCAAAWPPFLASASSKASGDLGIIKRKDNTLQWTLSGQPLYFWAGDQSRGDATGDGVGGVWDVIKK